MKLGKKNVPSTNIFDYNIILLGEPKIGKTSLMKVVAEEELGDEGYIFCEIGMERGADAIAGINYINCPTWRGQYNELKNEIGFYDLVNDIVYNKTEDYPNLKLLVIDTIDQLIDIADQEAIYQFNQTVERPVVSVSAAYGGFGRGEKRSIDIMKSAITKLNEVGVKCCFIGHTKRKNISDPISGLEFEQVTSDQQSRYFNTFAKDAHVVATMFNRYTYDAIDSGKMGFDGKKQIINRVTGSERRIAFRNSTTVESCGGRFAEIVEETEATPEAFIQTIKDAISAEISKTGTSVEKVKSEQEKKDVAIKAENDAKSKALAEEKLRVDMITEIYSKAKENPALVDVIKSACAAQDIVVLKECEDLDKIKAVYAAVNA